MSLNAVYKQALRNKNQTQKNLTKIMNSLILIACLNITAASDYGIVEIEETWDGRRVLKRRVRQADDDELGSGDSVEPLPSVSRVSFSPSRKN